MKIKHGMILAAGLGRRMLPITLKTPKPLIKLGNKNLLERSIDLLINHGVEEIAINVHYLADQIINFIKKKNYKIKITISNEKEEILNTGGGIMLATKSFTKPFIAINPDTVWTNVYKDKLKELENLYFENEKPCLLLVNKKFSFDNTFQGDFNLKNSLISRDNTNDFIFTGLQILNQNVFHKTSEKVFSMNKIWDDLIKNKSLFGIQSENKFYHLNTKDMYEKISELKTID